jgi:predicted ester cyclase
MEQLKKNKEFIVEYFNALSGVDKTRQLISRYVDDEHLIEHILFFESVFPKYELIADEVTSEDNRVVIYGRFKGKHLGELNGIPPTFKTVELPLAVGYRIEKNKIISHWLVINQMMLMEQLGVSAVHTE